nr:MarR family transcriptional regulator [Paenibacillus turicensis]
MKVLFIVRKYYKKYEQGITISEISTKMEVTSPTITQLIKGLETKGFVIRLNDQVDRRVVRVELTEAGEEVTNKAVHQFSATIQGLCDFLGEEKTKQFIDLLNSSYQYLDGEYKKKQH